MKITVIGLGGNSVFLPVDHFHREGETVKATSFFSEPGGKGYNQAVAAARLGADVSFIGAFGKDPSSAECIGFLEKEGVRPIVAYKNVPCAYACILTDSVGENRVTVYGGAAALLSAEDIKNAEDAIKEADILILQNEVPDDANAEATRLAKKHGVTLMYNPAPALGADPYVLSAADIITPNHHEATCLFGDGYRHVIANSGFTRAAVTLGSNGVDAFVDGVWHRIPAYKVTPVDTTGGGDCFNGALAVGLCSGKSFIEACDFACKAASVAISRPHAVEAMPRIEEIIC